MFELSQSSIFAEIDIHKSHHKIILIQVIIQIIYIIQHGEIVCKMLCYKDLLMLGLVMAKLQVHLSVQLHLTKYMPEHGELTSTPAIDYSELYKVINHIVSDIF